MSRRAPQIELTIEERTTLENITRSPSAAQRDVLRARIVLLAGEGLRNEQIQERLGVSKPVVIKWRRRYAADRWAGLIDEPGRGRRRKYGADIRHRIAATACRTPPESVGTHWSVRTLARHLGVGVAVVRSVLSAESIPPHRFRYWKDSPDPEFEPKMLRRGQIRVKAVNLRCSSHVSVPHQLLLNFQRRAAPFQTRAVGVPKSVPACRRLSIETHLRPQCFTGGSGGMIYLLIARLHDGRMPYAGPSAEGPASSRW